MAPLSRLVVPCAAAALAWGACARRQPVPAPPPPAATRPSPFPVGREAITEPPEGEARHLRALRQVTLDGVQNSEPAPSPDGRWLAVVHVPERDAGPSVVILDAQGRNRRALSPPGWASVSPVWLPGDGGRVLFSSRDGADGGPTLDVWERAPGGEPPARRLALPGDEAELSWNPAAGLLFTATVDGEGDVYRVPPDGGAPLRLTRGGGPSGSAAATPDGRFVVYRTFQDGGAHAELFIVSAEGGTPRQLTALGVTAWSPAMHPSGRRVVFSADLRPHARAPGQNFDLYQLDLETGALERVTFTEGPDTLPAFTADGRTLYWTSGRQGGSNQVFAAEWVD
ncbi:MAG: PD40 domain-containing protein [Deltaproteobacteria bacterium]|nr:PD40 domain-containing protein [Deltaproteobacteria bacterium]